MRPPHAAVASTPSTSGAADARAWINAWRARSNAADARAWITNWRSSQRASPAAAVAAAALEYGPKLALVGALYATDCGLKQAAAAAGVTFPPALAGMLVIVAALVALASAAPDAADAVAAAAAPGLDWIARWLPLFYVPSLVVLPVALQGIAGACVVGERGGGGTMHQKFPGRI